MPVQALLFDLYGTLVTPSTSWRVVRDQLPQATRAHGAELRARLMTTSEDIFALFRDNLESVRQQLENDIGSIQTFPEVVPVLEKLRAQGIPLALVSNLTSRYRAPFHALGLDRFFDVVTFSCDLGRAKPDRKIFEHTCQELGVRPKNAVMIGDSLAQDVRGAEGAGLQALLVDRTGRYADEANVERNSLDLRGALHMLDKF